MGSNRASCGKENPGIQSSREAREQAHQWALRACRDPGGRQTGFLPSGALRGSRPWGLGRRKWGLKCVLTGGVEWGHLGRLLQVPAHAGERRGPGTGLCLLAAAWPPRHDVLAKESNGGLQSPWVSFVTVTNRQGRQSWHSGAHPCRRITRPQPMRQAHWHLGVFLLKQKQYDCWHQTPWGRAPQPQPGRGFQKAGPELSVCFPEFTRRRAAIPLHETPHSGPQLSRL